MKMKLNFSICILLFVLLFESDVKGQSLRVKDLKPITRVHSVVEHLEDISEKEMTTLAKTLVPKLDSRPPGRLTNVLNAGKTGIKEYKSGAAVRGQFPWQAAITIDASNFCGGSLIHIQWILTAGHCAHNRTTFTVTLGAQSRDIFEGGRIHIESNTKFVHSQYSPETLINNIALIKLAISVTANSAFLNEIRLPKVSDATKTFAGYSVVHSGWGAVVDPEDGEIDLSTSMVVSASKVIGPANCSVVYGPPYVNPSVLCINTENIRTCVGDSGGPLVHKETDGHWTQIGIHSFGTAATCLKGLPSGFIRVASYLGWISTTSGRAVRP